MERWPRSHYDSFICAMPALRMCNEERKVRASPVSRQTGSACCPFQAAAKPLSAEAIGKYAIRSHGTTIMNLAFIPGGTARVCHVRNAADKLLRKRGISLGIRCRKNLAWQSPASTENARRQFSETAHRVAIRRAAHQLLDQPKFSMIP